MVNISVAQMKARKANDEYNSYVDQGLDSGEGWDYSTLDTLRELANQADAELLAARDWTWECEIHGTIVSMGGDCPNCMNAEANHGEEALAEYEQWEHDQQRWQECTCRPDQDAYLCPSCRQYVQEKYGDSIPFGGE